MIAHCSHSLTDLRLEQPMADPGEYLLPQLHSLKRFSWHCPIVTFAPLTIIHSLIKHADVLTALKWLELSDDDQFRSLHLQDFLPIVPNLRTLILNKCDGVNELAFLQHAKPALHVVKLIHLNFPAIEERTARKQCRLFPRLQFIDCTFAPLPSVARVIASESKSHSMTVAEEIRIESFDEILPPAAHLVGIEPNSGPTSNAHSLYHDAIHSIFAFLDLNPDYSLLHAASTCHEWMSAAESMKLPSVSLDDSFTFIEQSNQLVSLTLKCCQLIGLPHSNGNGNSSSCVLLTHHRLDGMLIAEVLSKQNRTVKIRIVDEIDKGSPIASPPYQKRLIGIELNPGPSSPSSCLSVAQSLYDDALHSIFTFLIDSPSFSAFIASANTCTRWMSAAESMHPPKQGTSSNHTQIQEKEEEEERQLRSSSTTPSITIDLDSHRLDLLCRSRLRHHVLGIRYGLGHRCDSDLTNQMNVRLSHLKQLELVIIFDSSNPIEFVTTTTEEEGGGGLPLPASLVSLTIHLITADIDIGPRHLSDPELPYIASDGAFHILRCDYFAQCRRIMQSVADGIIHSGCHQLSKASIFFDTYEPMTLPSCALRPLMSIGTITHLCIMLLTLDACDLICNEWYNANGQGQGGLKRLDIVDSSDRCSVATMLQRMICCGSSKAGVAAVLSCNIKHITQTTTSTPCTAAVATVASIPPLQLCHIINPPSHALSLLSHFTQITDLKLVQCRYDPSEILLVHLPRLEKFCWWQESTSHNEHDFNAHIDQLIDGLIQHASQLKYLELRGQLTFEGVHHVNLCQLVKALTQLRWFTLHETSSSPVIANDLSFLKHAAATLKYLNLKKMTIASQSREELKKLAQHIRYVTVTDCIFLVDDATTVVNMNHGVASTPPVAPLVGIELNPGPSEPRTQSLYVDVLHSIFIFLDLNRDYSLVHAASTCRQWMSATESMKPQYTIDRAVDPFASAYSSSQLTDSRFYFTRQLHVSQVEHLLRSRLRHHIDSLVYTTNGEQPEHDEMLIHLSQLHSRMPHLRRLSCTLHLHGQNIASTAMKVAINFFKTVFSGSVDTSSLIGNDSSITSFHLPSQLRLLDVTLKSDTDDLIAEISEMLAASLLPVSGDHPSSTSSFSFSSLTHLTITPASHIKSESKIHFTDSALRLE